MKKKKVLIADLAAASPDPLGFIRWEDGTEHDVCNPVDCKWPDHLRLMRVDQEMDDALENAPRTETEAEALRESLIAAVEGLKSMMAPLIPTVTPAQWLELGAWGTFHLAHQIRAALTAAGQDLDPTPTNQTTTTTPPMTTM